MADLLSSSKTRVLVVDDDADVVKAAALLLGRCGFAVTTASCPDAAWSALAAAAPEVVLLDLNFSRAHTSGAEGLQLLRRLTAQVPAPAVVVVTGHSGVAVAVEAMRAGAADFVMKPWSNARLVDALEQAAERRRALPGPAASAGGALETLMGDSPALVRARDLLERAAATCAPLLLYGEAGTGKTLAAGVAHRRSTRASAPLVTLEGAYADLETLEARWRAAEGATLLLDNVEALAPGLQARLAERLENAPDLRLITTTRAAPDRISREAGLRADLHERLNTVEVRLPPLRERGADPELLAAHFLRLSALRHGRAAAVIPAEAWEAVRAGPWPDEVRGLRLAAERAVILGDASPFAPRAEAPGEAGAAHDLNLERSERALIERSLKLHAFNVSRAATALGLTRAALYRRMSKHGL